MLNKESAALETLRTGSEYRRVRSAGNVMRLGPMKVFRDHGSQSGLRVGIVTPRRLGKAVTRNRIKRRLKAAYQLEAYGNCVGLDIVVHPALEVATCNFVELRQYVRKSLTYLTSLSR